MANYDLVINSQFKPFSYQEMLAPTLMATQAHQDLENQYGALAEKANVWDKMTNSVVDATAHATYENYAKDLEERASQLAKKGLSTLSRKEMLNMKSRYSKEMVPIEQAYKTREALIKEQRDIGTKDLTRRFQRDAASISLDELINNPTMDYGKSFSGALLAQQASNITKNLKEELHNIGKMRGAGLPYQFEKLFRYGYTREQIDNAINNPQEGDPVLTHIMDMIMDSSDLGWATDKQKKEARKFIGMGMFDAIGKTDIKQYTDQYGMQIAAERRAAARKDPPSDDGDEPLVRPSSLYTSEEKNNHSNIQNNIEKWISKGYLKRGLNGDIIPTRGGMKYANKTAHYRTNSSWEDPMFRQFVRNLGAVPDKTAPIIKIGDLASKKGSKDYYQLKSYSPKLARAYMNKINNGYDANQVTEFIHDYSPEEQTRVMNMIRRALGNSSAQIIQFKDTKSGYVPTGETISKEELMKYELLANRNSQYGEGFTLETKDGKKQITIKVPELDRERQAAAKRYYQAGADATNKMKELEPTALDIYNKRNQGLLINQEENNLLIEYEAYGGSYAKALKAAERETTEATVLNRPKDVKLK